LHLPLCFLSLPPRRSSDLGEPIVLDEEKLFEKIVLRRRGGFCYELNGLFAALLEQLGFRVARLAGRVGVDGIAFDHMALRVDLRSEGHTSELQSPDPLVCR